jgi:hypothetical protein
MSNSILNAKLRNKIKESINKFNSQSSTPAFNTSGIKAGIYI